MRSAKSVEEVGSASVAEPVCLSTAALYAQRLGNYSELSSSRHSGSLNSAIGQSVPNVRRSLDRGDVVMPVVPPQSSQEFSLPPLDVVFADIGKQRLVAGAPFLKRIMSACERALATDSAS